MIRFRFGHTVSLGKGVQSVTTRYVMITHNSSSPKSTSFRTEHPNPKMSLWSHVVEGESTKVTGNVTFGTSSILQCLCTTLALVKSDNTRTDYTTWNGDGSEKKDFAKRIKVAYRAPAAQAYITPFP